MSTLLTIILVAILPLTYLTYKIIQDRRRVMKAFEEDRELDRKVLKQLLVSKEVRATLWDAWYYSDLPLIEGRLYGVLFELKKRNPYLSFAIKSIESEMQGDELIIEINSLRDSYLIACDGKTIELNGRNLCSLLQ